MKIDIYKSTKSGDKYLSVPAGTDLKKLQFPENVDADILSLSPFKTRLELDASKPRNTLDQVGIQDQITRSGYAIHGAKITIEIGNSPQDS